MVNNVQKHTIRLYTIVALYWYDIIRYLKSFNFQKISQIKWLGHFYSPKCTLLQNSLLLNQSKSKIAVFFCIIYKRNILILLFLLIKYIYYLY